MESPFVEADIKIAKGFFELLKSYKNNSEFSDVVVLAGSAEFNCHRVILAAVSGFFRGLLSSGMRETMEGKVTLADISADVFSLILTCIYSGRSILTKENLFPVWAAADLLEIDFILKRCQEFYTETLSLDNCFQYCASVRLFNDESNKEALDFINKNFQKVRFSEALYHLSFEEMKCIVSSENLCTSCEDDVIETILRWAELTSTLDMLPDAEQDSLNSSPASPPAEDVTSSSEVQAAEKEKANGDAASADVNKESLELTMSRSELLAELLESSRYLLVSKSVLEETLSCHPLVQGHPRCQAIVSEISRYQSSNDLHQEWCPSAAIHREKEAVKNVIALFSNNGVMNVIYPSPKSMCSFEMKNQSMNRCWSYASAYAIYHHEECLYLFEYKRNSEELSFYLPSSSEWKGFSIDKVQQRKILIARALYTFEKNDKDGITSVFKLSLHDCVSQYPIPTGWQSVCQLTVRGLRMKGVTSIGKNVIVFWEEPEMRNVTVECYDLFRRKSVIMKNRLGSIADMITFRRDKEAFVLQTTGALWKIHVCPTSGQLVFTQELQLWVRNLNICRALLYGKYLIVFGRDWLDDTAYLADVSLDGVFSSVIYHRLDYTHTDTGVPCVHAVLPKHLLPPCDAP